MPGDGGGGAGKDAQAPPGETEAGGAGVPAACPRSLRPCQPSQPPAPPHGGWGSGKALPKGRGRPGLGVCGPRPTPRQGADLREDRGSGARRRVGTEPSALEPLTWRAGARKAELAAAAQGAAERRTQSAAPPPRGRRRGREGEARGPRPSPRPRVRGARDAARGAGALCLGASGAPLASASRPGPRRAVPASRAPASSVSRSRGVSASRGGGLGPEPAVSSPPSALGVGARVWVPGAPAISASLPVSPSLTPPPLVSAPLPGARRSPARVSMASSLGAERSGDKEAGLGLALPTPGPGSAPPTPSPAPAASTFRSAGPGPSPGPPPARAHRRVAQGCGSSGPGPGGDSSDARGVGSP